MPEGLLIILSDIHVDEKPVYYYLQLKPTSILRVILKDCSHFHVH